MFSKFSFFLLLCGSLAGPLRSQSALPDLVAQLRSQAADTLAWQQLKLYFDTCSLPAEQLARTIEQITTSSTHPRLNAELLRQLGIAWMNESAFGQSSDCLWKAMRLAESISDAGLVAAVRLNLGALNYHLQQVRPAIVFWLQALRYFEPNGPAERLGKLYANLGAGYSELDLLDSAEYYHRRALSVAQKARDALGMAMAWNNLGVSFEYRDRYHQAIACYEKARRLQDSLGNTLEVMRILSNMASATEMTGQLDKAQALNEQVLALNKGPADKGIYRMVYFNLASMGERQGRFDQAYHYLGLYYNYRDSLITEENTRHFQELEARFETEKKEKEINRLHLNRERVEARLRQQRILLAGSFALLALLSALVWQVYRSKRRSEELLANILPLETIGELKHRGAVQARRYDSASVLFTDFKEFTSVAEQLPPEQLVAEIDHCFRAFDAILERHPVEKIKTIGDAYMCASGLPAPHPQHAQALVAVALEMQAFMSHYNAERRAQGLVEFPMRAGIHSGPVVAGVVGTRKFTYDIWGDTVNTAARMESAGAAGQVNISESTFALLDGAYRCTPRGSIEVKHKAPMQMYFVEMPG